MSGSQRPCSAKRPQRSQAGVSAASAPRPRYLRRRRRGAARFPRGGPERVPPPWLGPCRRSQQAQRLAQQPARQRSSCLPTRRTPGARALRRSHVCWTAARQRCFACAQTGSVRCARCAQRGTSWRGSASAGRRAHSSARARRRLRRSAGAARGSWWVCAGARGAAPLPRAWAWAMPPGCSASSRHSRHAWQHQRQRGGPQQRARRARLRLPRSGKEQQQKLQGTQSASRRQPLAGWA